jgi:hypothetical protein
MAIGVPPENPAQLSESEAEALFEEAREIERRRRRRKLAGASLAGVAALAAGIGFGVGGGGGGLQFARHGANNPRLAGSNQPQQQPLTETVAMVAVVCMPASQPATPADPPPGQCVTSLPNGHRYKCPIGVENGFGGNGKQAATDSACHRVAAPRIPVSWRPTIVRMHRVTACLQRAGLTAAGGTTAPVALRAYLDAPIAVVMITGTQSQNSTTAVKLIATPTASRPSVVSFYLTAARARQAYNRTLPNVASQEQGMATRGHVLYTWNNQSAREQTVEQSCVQTA